MAQSEVCYWPEAFEATDDLLDYLFSQHHQRFWNSNTEAIRRFQIQAQRELCWLHYR